MPSIAHFVVSSAHCGHSRCGVGDSHPSFTPTKKLDANETERSHISAYVVRDGAAGVARGRERITRIGGIRQVLRVAVPAAGPENMTMGRPSPISLASNPISLAACTFFALARPRKSGCEEIS